MKELSKIKRQIKKEKIIEVYLSDIAIVLTAKAREDGEICPVRSERHRFIKTRSEMQELQIARAQSHIHGLMALYCDWFGEILSSDYAEPHESAFWPQSPQNLPRIVWGHPHHHLYGCL